MTEQKARPLRPPVAGVQVAVPRDGLGELMLSAALLMNRRSVTNGELCYGCGRKKKAGFTFCWFCYQQLPEETRFRLVPSPLFVESEWTTVFAAAVKWLRWGKEGSGEDSCQSNARPADGRPGGPTFAEESEPENDTEGEPDFTLEDDEEFEESLAKALRYPRVEILRTPAAVTSHDADAAGGGGAARAGRWSIAHRDELGIELPTREQYHTR